MLIACGPGETPAAPEPPARGVLSPEWIYAPATEETRRVTGAVTVEARVEQDGPARAIAAAQGQSVRAVLSGPAPADPAWIAALGFRGGAPAMLYRVTAGNLCPSAQATHLVWSEPELIEDRTLALAVVSGGAPGETGSTVCTVLRYTRARGEAPGRTTEGVK